MQSTSLRSFAVASEEIADAVKTKIQSLLASIGNAFGVKIIVDFNPDDPAYPATINSEKETKIATGVAKQISSKDKVNSNALPRMISEDFAFMLQKKPGCYMWIGNGPVKEYGDLHTPNYNFNDEILPIGASYWVNLVERVLNKSLIF